jgi:hypothetical protein
MSKDDFVPDGISRQGSDKDGLNIAARMLHVSLESNEVSGRKAGFVSIGPTAGNHAVRVKLLGGQ